MIRFVCKSVIHNLVVTKAHSYCEGSIILDEAVMRAADIIDGERVLVANVTRGNRMETYAVSGERNSGIVETSGSMSYLAKVGDVICVMTFTATEKPEEIKRIDLNLHKKNNKL